ncbi:MAG TPA: acyl-CoA dehydrogenase family protein [Candidatus Acidoferrales bacterium]|nr:acyl-CoA dehydrogenase family protein [Candidatus Acidoferrales bacterium]
MDFSFSPEQEQLRTQARSFLEKRFPVARVAELATSDAGWDRASWPEIARLGWIGASIPEAQGGAGLTFLEEAIVFEELGRALYAGPYFSTVALALPALGCASNLLARVAAGALTATLVSNARAKAVEARPVGDRWLLRGEMDLVPDAGCVDAFVVEARGPEGVGLYFAERHDGRPRTSVHDTVDATRRLGRVIFEDADARLLAAPPSAAEILARTRRRALAALALEAVGVASRALALGVEHAKTREQFGRPIGAYQAVSHKLADSYVETELARSLAYWAAWCITEDDDETELAAIAAKAYAAEAAVAACERAVQVHGGMGFTWEHPLHRYYKRALWIESFDRSGAAHRAEIARSLLGG